MAYIDEEERIRRIATALWLQGYSEDEKENWFEAEKILEFYESVYVDVKIQQLKRFKKWGKNCVEYENIL